MPVEIDILKCRKCGFESLVDEPPCDVCGRQMANRDLIDLRAKLEKAEQAIAKAGALLQPESGLYVEGAARKARGKAYMVLRHSGVEWEELT